MFAIGHFALGYLAGKGVSKALNVRISVPLLLVVSVIPDIDLLLGIVNPTLFMHRGLLHSIVVYTACAALLSVFYGRRVLPYYAALLSHSLIGDYFTGGVGLFWPITYEWFGNNILPVATTANAIAELALFLVVTPIMFKLGDLRMLLRPSSRKWILIIGFGAVLGPMLSGGRLEGNLPTLLVVPSLFWLAIFAYSLFAQLRAKPREPPLNTSTPPKMNV
jgi:membrane-bound metal-dependent hydrolase YbcI (DUF457 family)